MFGKQKRSVSAKYLHCSIDWYFKQSQMVSYYWLAIDNSISFRKGFDRSHCTMINYYEVFQFPLLFCSWLRVKSVALITLYNTGNIFSLLYPRTNQSARVRQIRPTANAGKDFFIFSHYFFLKGSRKEGRKLMWLCFPCFNLL